MRVALTLDHDEAPEEASDYVRALMAAGFSRDEIVVLPPGAGVDEDFDGVVLGGGVDVDPVRYGQAPSPGANVEVNSERDRTDLEAFDRAWREDAPILGICRGLQVVNVALGGTLVQDLPSQRPEGLDHQQRPKDRTRLDHTVRVGASTRLSGLMGATDVSVNSRHHQAVDRLAPGLVVSATAPDGTIEAAEAPGPRWCVAVQWHPENLKDDPASRRLFEAFARAVRERAGQPVR